MVSPQIESDGRVKHRFTKEMLHDIIPPLIEKNYRVLPNPENLASSGLSMVSIETLNIGLHHIVTFRHVAVMSTGWAADSDRDFFFKSEAAQIPKYNSQLNLFWRGWGQTNIARANGCD